MRSQMIAGSIEAARDINDEMTDLHRFMAELCFVDLSDAVENMLLIVENRGCCLYSHD